MATEKNDLMEKYANKALKFYKKDDHYELVFMDDFITPSSGSYENGKEYTLISEVVTDMHHADHHLELHVIINSYGGELGALAMLIESIREFEYTVAVCTGYACSAGFMLFSACDELYASPIASFVYHEPSSFTFGKLNEIRSQTDHTEELFKILMRRTSIQDILTEDELVSGKTTEVWLTGQELIDRGVVNDIVEYTTRKTPAPIKGNAYMVGKYVYVKKDGDHAYTRYSNSGKKYDYADILNIIDKEAGHGKTL